MAVLLIPADESRPYSFLSGTRQNIESTFPNGAVIPVPSKPDYPKLMGETCFIIVIVAPTDRAASISLPINVRFRRMYRSNLHLKTTFQSFLPSGRMRGDVGIMLYKGTDEASDRQSLLSSYLGSRDTAVIHTMGDPETLIVTFIRASDVFSFISEEWLPHGNKCVAHDMLSMIRRFEGRTTLRIGDDTMDLVLPKYITACFVCGATEGLTLCPGCRSVGYCSAACQQELGGHNCPGKRVTGGIANLGNMSNLPVCVTCSTMGTLSAPMKFCGGCKCAMYCNRACQKADWRRHRRACFKA